MTDDSATTTYQKEMTRLAREEVPPNGPAIQRLVEQVAALQHQIMELQNDREELVTRVEQTQRALTLADARTRKLQSRVRDLVGRMG